MICYDSSVCIELIYNTFVTIILCYPSILCWIVLCWIVLCCIVLCWIACTAYRVAKTHRMPYLLDKSFSTKEPFKVALL